jgi:hypothetical protein
MGQFTGSNDYLDGRKPVPTAESAHQVLSTRFTLAMATGDLDANDIGPIGILPAGHVPVSLMIDGTDMDSSTAALVVQFGLGNLALQDAAGAVSADAKNTLISTVAKDGGAAWGSSVNTGTDAAFMQTIVGRPMTQVTAVNYDRYILAKITTAPTTAVAGTLGLTLNYRPA